MSHWYSVSKQQIFQLHFSDMHPWSILNVFTEKVCTANTTDSASDRFLYARSWLIKHTGQAVHLPAHACTMEFYSHTEMVKVDHWFHRFPVGK
jgi:hypothetical protein